MDSSVLARNKKRWLTRYHGKIAHYLEVIRLDYVCTMLTV